MLGADGVFAATPGSERRRYRRQFIGEQQWQHLPDEQQDEDVMRRRTAARVAARLAVLKLTHAFYTWRRTSTGAVIRRESAQAQALLAQAQRIVHNRARRHFRAWLGYLISLRQEWIAEEHMLGSSLLKAFAGWVGVVEQCIALREGMMSLYLRRAMQLLRVCFSQLASNSVTRRHRRAALARAGRYFLGNAIGKAFVKWAAAVEHIVDWRVEVLHVVWTRWKHLASRAGHIERRACVLMLRWKLRHTASALRQWIEWAHVRRRMGVVVSLFQGKRKVSSAIMVLGRWRQYVADASRRKHALARAAFSTRRSLLRDTWDLWNDLSRLQLLRRRKMFAALYRRHQYAGFHGWLEYCRRHEEQRRKLGKALACMRRGHLAAAWRRWLTITRDSTHARQVMQRILGIMLNRRLHCTLTAWVGAVFTARSARSAREVAMGRALAKMMRRVLASAWHEWAYRFKRNQQLTKKLHFVITRLGQRVISLAFESWVQKWEWQRWASRTLSSALGRLSNALLNASYNAWVQLVSTRRCLRHVVGSMHHRQKDRLLLHAFRHFRTMVSQAVAMRNQNEAYLAQHTTALVAASRRLACRRMLRAVVCSWSTVISYRRRRTRLAQRAVGGMLRRALDAAFAAWSSFAFADPRDLKIERLQETIVLLYSRGWRRTCYIDVFKTWLLFIEERWEQRDFAKQNIDNLALELAIQTETERGELGRTVSALRY